MALYLRAAVLVTLLLAAAMPLAAVAEAAPGDDNKAASGGLRSSGGRPYERPDESFRAAFFDALESEEETEAFSAKLSKGNVQRAAKYAKAAPSEEDGRKAPASGLEASRKQPYEQPDESLRAAFLDAVENDEETKALSEKLSKGFRQKSAKYVVKASTDGLEASSKQPYERPDESLRAAFFDAIEAEEDTKALSETLSKGSRQKAAKYVVKAPAGGLKVASEQLYERPDESLSAAFFDEIESDEETKALNEKLSKGYRQKAAKYVVKGAKAAVGATV